MLAIAFCRNSLRTIVSFGVGNRALETSDRGGQDKARKVRAYGRLEDSSKFNQTSNIAAHRVHIEIFDNTLSPLNNRHLMSPT
jgi:hypothetical protein